MTSFRLCVFKLCCNIYSGESLLYVWMNIVFTTIDCNIFSYKHFSVFFINIAQYLRNCIIFNLLEYKLNKNNFVE